MLVLMSMLMLHTLLHFFVLSCAYVTGEEQASVFLRHRKVSNKNISHDIFQHENLFIRDTSLTCLPPILGVWLHRTGSVPN